MNWRSGFVDMRVTRYSPGAQGSKLSPTGPKGLKVVSNWKFCAESENQRLTYRTWEVFKIRRHCCHGDRLKNTIQFYMMETAQCQFSTYK